VTKGEIKIIFRTADLNDDNQISTDEWANFHGLFIEPFEEADGNGDYVLNPFGVDYVLQSDWFKAIRGEIT